MCLTRVNISNPEWSDESMVATTAHDYSDSSNEPYESRGNRNSRRKNTFKTQYPPQQGAQDRTSNRPKNGEGNEKGAKKMYPLRENRKKKT